jgi:hypothetical protein
MFSMALDDAPASVDLNRPNAARVYDYFLGGAQNFAVDREFAEQMSREVGLIALPARLNRSFLRRAVQFMTDEGIDQFIDLGSGIPTVGNVHEIAQHANPAARVVYVDNEPVAYALAKQILTGNDNATILQADLRDIHTVLAHPDTTRLIDFTQPVGLLTVAIMLFIPDSDDPAGILDRYRGALRGGGFHAITHFTTDSVHTADVDRGAQLYRQTTTPFVARTADQVRELLGGGELVEPGLTWTHQWRPDGSDPTLTRPEEAGIYAAVAKVQPNPQNVGTTAA